MSGQGKIGVESRVSLDTPEQLAEHYTPGVAQKAERLAGDRGALSRETVRSNSVAIVSDGSALLGLGDRGPEAALAVMEGKAALLKKFADVDAWPICPVSREPDDLVRTVTDLATSFGAINLEDIAAPRCFPVERRLQDELDVPVFHDDQHGTAITVLAALRNALQLTDRTPDGTSVVISGAGAAGSATAQLLLEEGFSPERLLVCDSKGVLHAGRDDLNEEKRWFAEHTNTVGRTGALVDALRGADVFIGVSTGGLLGEDDIAAMAQKPIVFALANPDPEVDPEIARRRAAVVATGRSDFPNQINNVLAFPGVFRGLLDGGSRWVTARVQLAAADALSHLLDEELRPDMIVPSIFDERVVPRVAKAVDAASR